MRAQSLFGYFALWLLSALVFCGVSLAAPPTVGFTAIAVRDTGGSNTERGAPDPPALAIDGDFDTSTYLTAAFTHGAQSVYLDLGGPSHIAGFRWRKVDNDYGPYDISFSTSSDSGTLLNRSFTPVSNLESGFMGTELVAGTISGNKILNEHGENGYFSVTFDDVPAATAVRFDFSTASAAHYHAYEFQAIVPEPAGVGLASICGICLSLRRRLR